MDPQASRLASREAPICTTFTAMEQTPNMTREAENSEFIPDLNCEAPVEQPTLSPISVVEFQSLTVEQMEERLGLKQPMESEDVTYGLYTIYALAKGFSVRKDKTEKFKDGSVRAKDFVCHCQGDKDEKRTPANAKATMRCKCKAKLRVARLKGQNWRITSFIKDHTHDLFPTDQAYLLRSARQMSVEMENFIEAMVKCGMSVAKIYDFLQTTAHGRENVGFTQKDMYNSISNKRRQTKIENGDAAQLVQYFIEKSNKEPYFYWNVERDDDKRLMNLFFRDYRCSIDYHYFGDVISVDTTYRTNMYNMSCCPFIGINHHMQNVMLGFAFMSDETEDSFVWLFKTFLKSMGDKQPITIFTDQCQAMMNAIEIVFPNSHHRLCHWHINQNAPSHFGNLNGNFEFKRLWHKCMTGCDDEEEFERTWKHMMNEYDIGDEDWFSRMYNLREKWVTAFSNGKFSAGLNATSRSEGTNSTLKKKFGGSSSSLYNCVLGYEKVQDIWRAEEKENDTLSHHGRLPIADNVWLTQASEIYTMKVLKLFQKEVADSMAFSVLESCENGDFMWFTMMRRSGGSRIIKVKFDRNTSSVNCSCHKFETTGILCSHALKVFDRVNLNFIPEKYIMKRWTRGVTTRVCSSSHVNGNGAADQMAFVHGTVREIYELASRAQFHKETRLVVTELTETAKEKLNAWFRNTDSTYVEDRGAAGYRCEADKMVVLDPTLPKAKGVTDVRERFWDSAKRKAKAKAKSRAKTQANAKGTKRKGSQNVPEDHPSQEANTRFSQEATNAHQLFPTSILTGLNATNTLLNNPRGYNFKRPALQPLQSTSHNFQMPSLTPPNHTNEVSAPYATVPGVNTTYSHVGLFSADAHSIGDPKFVQENYTQWEML